MFEFIYTHYRNQVVIFLFGTVILLYLLKIVVENRLATKGIDLVVILKETREQQKENVEIKDRILFLSSYQHIIDEARKMGFVESTDKDYIYITK